MVRSLSFFIIFLACDIRDGVGVALAYVEVLLRQGTAFWVEKLTLDDKKW